MAGREAGRIAAARAAVERRTDPIQRWAKGTLAWQVWERMLETEFVDRSVALAGKAFVSFFPMVIVIAAFMPTDIRAAILTTVARRLGVTGGALRTAKHAFASADDIRRATGIMGLALTFFFVNSFTTALQRVFLRAWRRPAGGSIQGYVLGALWLALVMVFFAALGFLRSSLSGVLGAGLYVIVAAAMGISFWLVSTWLLLNRQVRWRVLLPTATIIGLAMGVYSLTAVLWMPNVVNNNEHQFGFFGVALALVTWFSGAAMCIIVGACAGAVVARDEGVLGRFTRGRGGRVFVDGAPPSLPPPERALRWTDAFEPVPEGT